MRSFGHHYHQNSAGPVVVISPETPDALSNIALTRENLVLLTLELEKRFEGFPSCFKSHCDPSFLTTNTESFSTVKSQNREEAKRLNGLSVFVKDIDEQRSGEDDVYFDKIAKCESRSLAGYSSSDFKQIRKAIQASNKKAAEPGGPIFTRRGDKVIFKFRHFVNPEQLVEDYIKAHIYDKTTNKEILFITGQSPRVSNLKLSHEKDTSQVNGSGKKTSARKSHKVTRNMMHKTKQTRRIQPTKRITATHDFVYEFDPLATSVGNRNAGTLGNTPANLHAVNDEYTFSKLRRAFTPNSHSEEADLSKLHSHPNIAAGLSEKDGDLLSRNKSLPNIKQENKEQSKSQKVKPKSRYTHTSTTSDIDRQVEKIKSDWNALRRERGWARDKNYVPTACSRKVYDTLEKVTQQIDNMQRAYTDPNASQYLQRSAFKTLKATPSVSFEDEAARIREFLFPKTGANEANSKQSSADSVLLNKDDSLKDASTIIGTLNVTSQPTSPRKRSLLSITQSRTPRKPFRIKRGLGRRASTSQVNPFSDVRQTKQIRSEIDQYLNKYIDDVERSFQGNTEQKLVERKEVETSPQDVSDILEKLTVRSIDAGSISDNDDRICENDHRSENRGKTDRAIETPALSAFDLKATPSNQIGKNNERASFEQNMQESNAQNSEMKGPPKLGINELATTLPENLLSTIIHSEYLKKDFSLSM